MLAGATITSRSSPRLCWSSRNLVVLRASRNTYWSGITSLELPSTVTVVGPLTQSSAQHLVYERLPLGRRIRSRTLTPRGAREHPHRDCNPGCSVHVHSRGTAPIRPARIEIQQMKQWRRRVPGPWGWWNRSNSTRAGAGVDFAEHTGLARSGNELDARETSGLGQFHPGVFPKWDHLRQPSDSSFLGCGSRRIRDTSIRCPGI